MTMQTWPGKESSSLHFSAHLLPTTHRSSLPAPRPRSWGDGRCGNSARRRTPMTPRKPTWGHVKRKHDFEPRDVVRPTGRRQTNGIPGAALGRGHRRNEQKKNDSSTQPFTPPFHAHVLTTARDFEFSIRLSSDRNRDGTSALRSKEQSRLPEATSASTQKHSVKSSPAMSAVHPEHRESHLRRPCRHQQRCKKQ